MMRIWLVASTIFALGTECAAAPEFFTDSKAGDFATGQRLVMCAAYYDFTSDLATSIGKPSVAQHFGNLSRGWTLAGRLLLSSGANSAKFDSEKTSDAIKAARLGHLKAKFELGDKDVMNEMEAEHKRDCDPLIPLQEGVIQVLRQGPQASPPKKK